MKRKEFAGLVRDASCRRARSQTWHISDAVLVAGIPNTENAICCSIDECAKIGEVIQVMVQHAFGKTTQESLPQEMLESAEVLGRCWEGAGEVLGRCWEVLGRGSAEVLGSGSAGEVLGRCWGGAGEVLGRCLTITVEAATLFNLIKISILQGWALQFSYWIQEHPKPFQQ